LSYTRNCRGPATAAHPGAQAAPKIAPALQSVPGVYPKIDLVSLNILFGLWRSVPTDNCQAFFHIKDLPLSGL